MTPDVLSSRPFGVERTDPPEECPLALTPSPLPFAPPFFFSRDMAIVRVQEILERCDGPFGYRYVEPGPDTATKPGTATTAHTYTWCHQTTEHWTNLDGREVLDIDSDYVVDD